MTSIQQVIVMLDRMRADGVVQSYAIGGAVGATFVARHRLADAWQRFARQFLTEQA